MSPKIESFIPGPLRGIRSLLARMRAARLEHGDCGGQIEVEILDEHTAALTTALESNSGEAKSITAEVITIERKVIEIAADGQVTESERRQLALLFPKFSRLAKTHERHAANLLK